MKKTVYRIFTIADYEREAVYLRHMHQSGWKLVEVSFSPFLVAVQYTFESCDKEKVAYQLDFFPLRKAERPAYFQLFADDGWEHIQDFNGFSYFRKKVVGDEIYAETVITKSRGKIEMIYRIVRFHLLPELVLLLCMFPKVIHLLSRPASLLSSLIVGICVLFLLVLLFQILHILRVFYQKRRKLTEKENK